MDSIHSSLITLENLSKQISNLIYHNSFEKIPELDLQRQSLIKSIYINMLNIGTDCSGIEAPIEALKKICDTYGLSFEHVFSSEIDK